jgi:hypothetical protein
LISDKGRANCEIQQGFFVIELVQTYKLMEKRCIVWCDAQKEATSGICYIYYVESVVVTFREMLTVTCRYATSMVF